MAELRGIFRKINIGNLERILTIKVFKVNLGTLLVGIAIAAYTICFSYFTIMNDYTFHTYGWDLGIFNQAFWTTLHNGKFFYYTGELMVNPSGSFFGIHFSPILFLLLPVYALYPARQTFLVVQSLALALGAVPLYKLTMHVLKNRFASLVFVFVYLLYPPLQGINWFDFHAQCFLPVFFFSAVYFLEKQSWKGYFLFIVLALMCEEHAALIVLFIGPLVALRYRDRLLSALKAKNFRDTIFLVSVATSVLAVLWYLMTIWVRNAFFPINPAFLSLFKAAGDWSVLGVHDPIMIPLYILLNPGRAIIALNYDFLLKIGYLLILFGPLALRSFFGTKYLLPTIPWFLYALFSNYLPYYSILNQYPAYLIAFIFVAAVYSINNGLIHDLKAARKCLIAIFLCGLAASIIASPLSPIVAFLYPQFGPKLATPRDQLIHEVLAYLPSNASVATHNNLFPQVSSRLNAYALPTIDPLWNADPNESRIFVDGILGKVDYVLVDTKSDSFASSVVFSLMEKDHGFRVLVSADGVVLFKKNYEGNATVLAPYIVTYDYTNLAIYSGELATVNDSSSRLVLHFNGTLGHAPMFWYGPRSLLPPGTYNVTLRLRVNGTGRLFILNICSNNGQNIIMQKVLTDSDFVGSNTWQNQTFTINPDKPLVDFEVRAVGVSGQADIMLDYIDVKQILP
jgi:uncharacterized membrane protein